METIIRAAIKLAEHAMYTDRQIAKILTDLAIEWGRKADYTDDYERIEKERVAAHEAAVNQFAAEERAALDEARRHQARGRREG